jgi:hypothetical protein
LHTVPMPKLTVQEKKDAMATAEAATAPPAGAAEPPARAAAAAAATPSAGAAEAAAPSPPLAQTGPEASAAAALGQARRAVKTTTVGNDQSRAERLAEFNSTFISPLDAAKPTRPQTLSHAPPWTSVVVEATPELKQSAPTKRKADGPAGSNEPGTSKYFRSSSSGGGENMALAAAETAETGNEAKAEETDTRAPKEAMVMDAGSGAAAAAAGAAITRKADGPAGSNNSLTSKYFDPPCWYVPPGYRRLAVFLRVCPKPVLANLRFHLGHLRPRCRFHHCCCDHRRHTTT